MNEKQLVCVTAVERHRARVRRLAADLVDAERALKRAEAQLRTAVRKDPAAWHEVTVIPNEPSRQPSGMRRKSGD